MVSEIYLQQAFQATAVAKPESRSTGLKQIGQYYASYP